MKHREIEQVDGSLEEVKRVAREKAKAEQKSAKTLEDLQRIAAARGYSPRWAEHVHRARQSRQAEWRGQR
nr:hypothetical protein [Thiocapsa sp. KS1]